MAIPFGHASPFVDMLGCELQHFADGQSQVTLAAKPEHLNAFDVVHGGALMTLLDVTMAAAARSVNPGMGVVTVEMKTTFMQAAQAPLRAQGRLLHRTRGIAFTEASVFDAQDQLCCHATGTFKYTPRRGTTVSTPHS